MGRLDEKVAIVTGGAQGIGLGIATAMAKEGANIVLADFNAEKAQAAAGGIQALGVKAVAFSCDVSQRSQVKGVVQGAVREFGTVDILANVAQDMRNDVAFENTTDEDMQRALGSGLWGTFYFMQECLPYMKEKGGKIINMASAAGLDGHSGWTAYAAAKEGIRALTRVACHEWGRYKINVNAICPLADSPRMVDWGKSSGGMIDLMLAMVPAGRLGDCEIDIGRAAVFLACSDSDYITGQTLMVDGGQTMLR